MRVISALVREQIVTFTPSRAKDVAQPRPSPLLQRKPVRFFRQFLDPFSPSGVQVASSLWLSTCRASHKVTLRWSFTAARSKPATKNGRRRRSVPSAPSDKRSLLADRQLPVAASLAKIPANSVVRAARWQPSAGWPNERLVGQRKGHSVWRLARQKDQRAITLQHQVEKMEQSFLIGGGAEVVDRHDAPHQVGRADRQPPRSRRQARSRRSPAAMTAAKWLSGRHRPVNDQTTGRSGQSGHRSTQATAAALQGATKKSSRSSAARNGSASKAARSQPWSRSSSSAGGMPC